jgi:hypothetical protein
MKQVTTSINLTLSFESQAHLIQAISKLTTNPDDFVSVIMEDLLSGRRLSEMVRRTFEEVCPPANHATPLPDEDDALPERG